jgi:hypothetical protein
VDESEDVDDGSGAMQFAPALAADPAACVEEPEERREVAADDAGRDERGSVAW